MRVTDQVDVGTGDLVAALMPPGKHWVGLIEDIWTSGAGLLPLDTRLTRRELSNLISRARPAALVDERGVHLLGDALPVGERTGLVLATSGTSGTPRLAEISREAVTAAVHTSAAALGATSEDPWIACLSPSHAGGILVYLRGLLLGGPVRVVNHLYADDLSEGVYVSVIPKMVRDLIGMGTPLRGVTLLVGGGALGAAERAAATELGARIVQTYGLTETCGGIVYEGRPLNGTEVRTDADDVIELRGPTVMSGYRGDPQATHEAFTVEGWLRTGDIGSFESGSLVITGRADDRIRTGAETVWPEEVEAALLEHPKVSDVAAAGVTDGAWGERVAVWVVPRRIDDPPDLAALQEHCEGRLARFKFPRELSLVEKIPRTTTGKIRRFELQR